MYYRVLLVSLFAQPAHTAGVSRTDSVRPAALPRPTEVLSSPIQHRVERSRVSTDTLEECCW
jgi:hypothetical protein